ncbi:hypothetical protein [Streptomyces laurentii]|uniref:hypothetical protein n=1 Tax=Streptomyces laurentii TaxID=39478 RepID=UPI0036B69D03
MNSRAISACCLLLVPLSLALAGCGTETGTTTAGDPTGQATGTPTPSAPPRAELEERARYAQVDPKHVYVTEADGFTLARQSAGVMGDDGFQATYVAPDGTQITLTAERGTFGDKECAATARGDRCTAEKPGWYRVSAERHTYIRAEDGVRIEVGAPPTVRKDLLRAAAEHAHRADDRELDGVLPEKPAGGWQPVERGDLPPVGDGAPDNSVGVGG